MELMRELFNKARLEGRADIRESPFPRDWIPFVYKGESRTGQSYYNSGGRSVIFERDGSSYKMHGVDPYGRLTKRVAEGGKNLTSDVWIAKTELIRQRKTKAKTFNGKPFGVPC